MATNSKTLMRAVRRKRRSEAWAAFQERPLSTVRSLARRRMWNAEYTVRRSVRLRMRDARYVVSRLPGSVNR